MDEDRVVVAVWNTHFWINRGPNLSTIGKWDKKVHAVLFLPITWEKCCFLDYSLKNEPSTGGELSNISLKTNKLCPFNSNGALKRSLHDWTDQNAPSSEAFQISSSGKSELRVTEIRIMSRPNPRSRPSRSSSEACASRRSWYESFHISRHVK